MQSSPSIFSQSYRVFPDICLRDLFPADLTLESNEEVRMLSLLSTQGPHILTQQQFTKNEWLILRHLIQDYPHYVPHEILLAELTLLSPNVCRQLLQEMRLQGPNVVVHELKPVYRALSNARAKLSKLYPRLRISLVRNMGYTLTLAPEEDLPEK